ncbi:hypothetical protein M9Y10_042366 [Tritrichomonas musculus]|uniref:non-specific serine/threonine protein kinase n=1 Tax=Tritrichomonas musculus TaxID=1915356 RepID=A0ABR2GPQ3_9EUKA
MAQNANENNVLPNKTKVDHYIIDSHIGHGGYGEIYAVYDDNHKGPWAMKVEMKSAKKHGLTEEIHYLKMLRGSPMFPEYICNGETNDLKYFIMELLGPSVSLIRRSLPDLRYTQLTATILAKEMLKCIEELHKRGYVHRDIKPGNFLIRPNRQNPIVLIDFGLSRRFADRDTGKPLPPRHNPGFIGTCSFASLNAHEGKELGRRDDIFSWIYTVIEMVDKRLPWPGSKDREKTYRLKQQIRPYDLCHSLPRAFTTIYIKTLDYNFEDKPDYPSFYKMLDRAIQDLGGYGKPFDWERLPPDVISRISAIPLDMGPLGQAESEDKDNNYSQDKEKDNNRKNSKNRKNSTIENKNNDNQSKQKAQRDKALVVSNNESKNQNNQENNQRKRTKTKSSSIANTTTATNETNNDNKKEGQNHINKQEETVPEQDENEVSGANDNDDDSGNKIQLKTAPPRDEPKIKTENKNHRNTNKNDVVQKSSTDTRTDPQQDDQVSDKEPEQKQKSDSDTTSDSDSDNQRPQEKPQTNQVNNKNVNNTNNNHETPKEEPKTVTKDTKSKKKKGKSDEEPGCKACIIS